jgi:molybdopterin synthase catalytic subunit
VAARNLNNYQFVKEKSALDTISVRVRLFATLKQQAGWTENKIEAPVGTTLGDFMALLMRMYPDLKLTGRAVYAAVNQNYAKPDHVLGNGDEVAIFPPVSGGVEMKR